MRRSFAPSCPPLIAEGRERGEMIGSGAVLVPSRMVRRVNAPI